MFKSFAVIALGAVAATTVIAPRLSTDGQENTETARVLTAKAKGMTGSGSGNTMVLERGASGQFHLTASIDNEDVAFLVDTGADVVALTEDTAAQLGLSPAEDDFQPVMKTASGTGYGAPIMLDSVEIGGERFRQVEAVVMKGLGTNLMGQSVLRRMGGVELTGDSMVIRPS